MLQLDTIHDTLVFERHFSCSLDALYAAFADPVARARWGVPSSTAVIIYDEADFRVGGRDRSRCGARDDPRFHVEVTYLDIWPKTRIVYAERVAEGDTPLSGALYTLEFAADGGGACLKTTVQIASFGGPGMAEGTRQGFRAALDNLEAELGRVET
jgi:uncharacterized protein YndB with AHSA1/START domain